MGVIFSSEDLANLYYYDYDDFGRLPETNGDQAFDFKTQAYCKLFVIGPTEQNLWSFI